MNNWFARGGKVANTLIGINALVYLADTASDGAVQNLLALGSETMFSEPWTLITYAFAHSGLIHLALNMYSLWVFGEALERSLGTNKFLAIYFGSVIAGGLAFAFLEPGYVVGASGAIFGLMAAYFVLMRAMGYRSSQMFVLIVLNVVLGFMNPSVAITTHIGGLIAGGAIAWYYVKARR